MNRAMRWVEEYAPAVLLLIAAVILWQVVVIIFKIPSYLVPLPTAVASALVDDMNPVIECKSGCGGGGGGGQDFGVSGLDSGTGPFVDGWEAKGYSPAGVKTFLISNMSIFFKGPWQVSWQPSSP